MTQAAQTLVGRLEAAADGHAATFVFHLDEGEVRLTGGDLRDRALDRGRRLVAGGVQVGDRVALLGLNRPEWIEWAFGIWAAGATLVPVQIPLRVRDPDAFAEQVRALIDAAGCSLVIVAPELAFAASASRVMTWDDEGVPCLDGALPEIGPDHIAVVQFTSGSTARPRGVQISHGAVLAQIDALDRMRNPVTVGWTPFFHDLGLFLYIVWPALSGMLAHLLPTERFARDPAQWLRLVEATRATMTVGPCSAWAAALQTVVRSHDWPDLSSLRLAWFAAEGVDPETVDRLLAHAPSLRLDPGALGSTYGLAEAVLAVATSGLGDGIHIDRVDPTAIATSGHALPATGPGARRIVSCGHLVWGARVRVMGTAGTLPDRDVGEIQVSGPSLMQGYLGAADGNPIAGGWLATGDMGYLSNGQLYVTGRAKDIVIVMGHNYFPEDFEWAAARVPGVRAGRCVAFGNDAKGVVVLVEPRSQADPHQLRAAVRRAVTDAAGVRPADVMVLPAGTVQKTTSGKLRRSAMRAAYTRGELTTLALGGPGA